MFRSSHRFGLSVALALLTTMLAVGLLFRPVTTHSDPVTEAWQRVRAAGSYRFTGDVTQLTIPTSKITNVGRTSRTERLHLEGLTDLRQSKLELGLWSDGGSVAQANSGVHVRVENGKTLVRQGMGEWKEADNITDGFAPQGDFMAYLAAVRDVTPQATETRAGLTFTRYSFRLDGPAFADYIRPQLEEAMRQKGELPRGAHIEIPRYYRDMTGSGELWVHDDGLPLRQVLTVSFPEQRDDYSNAQITIDFLEFGQLAPASTFPAFGDLGNLAGRWLILITALACVGLILYYRRARWLQHGLAGLVIASLVFSPLVSAVQINTVTDARTARAAEQDEQRQASDMQRALRELDTTTQFNPHEDPFAAANRREREAAQLAAESGPGAWPQDLAPAPPAEINQPPTDNGTDTDHDGLTDFEEERVGTASNYFDSDEDLITDTLEVKGFQLGGQTWYPNALEIDSNRDGLGDGQEWDNNRDGIPDDTDGDGLPDLFDPDNDNDGVPDGRDLAPFTRSQSAFAENSPLELTLNNLTAGKSTFVDFQVRPVDEKHLWFAFNVLDWPHDSKGQVQDIDQRKYSDVARAQGRTAAANESYGDMKLIPMLEIRVPNSGANLPPVNDLVPYNITANNFTADGSTKVVYVPLSVMTDQQTGARVAFSGRMRYLPTGSWPAPHSVRLAWLVQTLVDQPCDPNSAADRARGCQALSYDPQRGFIFNVPQVVQTYYDTWILAGLNVSEDHGTGMAIIYEDPAVDPNKKDDFALTALSHGLDNAFLAARDQDNNGQRDMPLSEIVRRFDRTQNASVSEEARWAIPNILRVERTEYDTYDKALMFTAMTETVRILNTQFNASWTADRTIKPLLMYAHEQRSRGLGLDAASAGDGYVRLQGNGVIFDMQPAGQPRVTLDVMTGVKWMPYCAPVAATPAWDACTAEDFWNELERRHAAFASQPGDPADPDIAGGRMVATQLYALTLMQGINRVVQSDNRLISSLYSLKTDGDWAGYVRLGVVTGIGSGVPFIANVVFMARYTNNLPVLKYLQWVKLATPIQAGKDTLQILKKLTTGNFVDRLKGTGIIAGAAALLGGLATLGYYFLGTNELAAKITVKVLIIGLSLIFNVVLPIKTVVSLVSSVSEAGKILKAGAEIIGNSKKAGAIGAAIAVAATWGFFVYSMVAGGVQAFSPEFNRALAETIAATIYIILLAVLSATVIGAILVAFIAFIDAILTAVCELGVDELRRVPGMGGACFTLGNAAIKGLAWSIYNYDPMINTSRADLLVTGSPRLQFADPSKGFVVGNALSVSLPVTTTIVHKDPDPANGVLILPYMWLYSASNLRTSTFRYSLTRPDKQDISASRNQMNSAWQDVREDHRWLASPMYRGQATTTPSPLTNIQLSAGLNQPLPFYLNMGYAVPAYECWGLLILGVCYTRELTGNTSTPIDALFFDVFPATLDAFMTLVPKGTAGLGLAWDAAFPALLDADGDGLITKAQRGVDPDDATWDADHDGLADAYELERRQDGVAFSATACDTDGDGLTDLQEVHFGTNPALQDTDRDGLTDGQEVWHRRYNASCQATNIWEGGWTITVNGVSPFSLRVESDPRKADSDGDGIDDLAERALAQTPSTRLDSQNRPYHPGVVNTPPVAVYAAIDDPDGLLGPGQTFAYITTVVTSVALNPSPLDVIVPPTLGNSPSRYTLNFNPATFSGTQTITQLSPLTVRSNATSHTASITSRVAGQLSSSGVITASSQLEVTVDGDRPTSAIDSVQDGQFVQAGSPNAPLTVIIGGSASDSRSGVTKVEVSVNNGPWQTANGTSSWTFPLEVVQIPFTANSGIYTIRTRATDGVGNVETPGAGITLIGDATAPDFSDLLPDQPIVPTRATSGAWTIPLRFSVRDLDIAAGAHPGSGVVAETVEARLRPFGEGASGSYEWQPAMLETGNLGLGIWTLTYHFPATLADPTGQYALDIRAADQMGNRWRDDSGTEVLVLDSAAPVPTLNPADAARGVISQTLTLSGAITDTNSLIGLDKLEVAFVPMDHVVPLADASLVLLFDESPDNVYYLDSSGQGNHARCALGSGCPIAGATGRTDRALQFDGASLVQVANHPSLNFASDAGFSLQAWVKTTVGGRILTKGSFSNAYRLTLAGGGQVVLQLYDQNGGEASVSSTGPSLLDDQWHQIVVTMDRAAAQAHLYVDGQLQASTPVGSVAFDNPADLDIGGAAFDQFVGFTGAIDEVTVVGHALNAAEVRALYQAANRQWLPATLAQRGPRVAATTWSLAVPSGLEGQYQIDLRATDLLGNRAVTGGVWRGVIDTLAPRLVMTATATGASYLDSAGVRHYAVAYVCAAQDQHLSEADFACPGTNLPTPTRSFDDDPILQSVFPDVAIRNRLALAYTRWEPTTQISRSMRACDTLGNCNSAIAQLTITPPAVTQPQALVVSPAAASIVATSGAISVTVTAASASGQLLREVTLSLDGAVVDTATFTQGAAITHNQRVVVVTASSEGEHTLVARATDWAGNVQTSLFPVTFTLDTQPPSVAIATSLVTLQDTYEVGSGVLRFHGTASDTLCLAAVKVRVDNGPWADANFGGGTWRIAYPVNAPEGRTLNVAVEATDCAGRTTDATRSIGTNLSSPTAPDTTITSRPSNPSGANNVSFSFTAIQGANDVAGFACQLDDGPFTPCTSPWRYSSLTAGAHTFRVRAVDTLGFVDVTPASYSWTVTATAPSTTLYLPLIRRK